MLRSTVTANADLEAATAWRQGRVIFHDEPLREAARRLNRYSRLQIKVDSPELVDLKVSEAQVVFSAAGFTGAYNVSQPPNGDYRVKSQDLAFGQYYACTASVTVSGN